MSLKVYMTKLEKRLDKLKGLISIARKAGFCIIGQDNLKNYDKKLYLLLMDEKAGNSLAREMNFLSSTRQIPLLLIENLEDLTTIKNCKALGIKNKNISQSIQKEIKGE